MSNYIRDVQYMNAGKAKKEIDNMILSHCSNVTSVKSMLTKLNDGTIIDEESAKILNDVYDICIKFENDLNNEYCCESDKFDTLFSLFNLRKKEIERRLSACENIIDVEASTVSSKVSIDNLNKAAKEVKEFAVDKVSHNDVVKYKKHKNIKIGKPSKSVIKSFVWLAITIIASLIILTSFVYDLGVDVSIENDFDRAKISSKLEANEEDVNKIIENDRIAKEQRRERNRSHE